MERTLYKVLIRADASTEIGTGHIMRDLVLAKQFINAKVVFATRDLNGNLNEHIKQNGFDVITLKSNEIDELVSVIKKYNFQNDKIDALYQNALSSITTLKLAINSDKIEEALYNYYITFEFNY